MVEIKVHNPKLRLTVNIALGVLFAVFFIFTGVLTALDSRRIAELDYRIAILKDDVLKKQEALFATQRKFEQTRSRMTPRQMVDASLDLQEQRDKLARNQDQLAASNQERDTTARKKLTHIYWLIFALIACPAVFWVNYVLNY